MNDLEKNPAQVNPDENPQCEPVAENTACDPTPSPVEANASETQPDVNVEAPADDNCPDDVIGDATEANNDAPAEKEIPNFHLMSKAELLDALRSIVNETRAESHREVSAIRQAFHAIRSRERDQEMNDYIEKGGPIDAFASAPDEAENEFNQLLADFKDIRQKHLAAEDERRQENLRLKQDIIDKIKSINDDIDNINLHFPKLRELQAQFKEIKDIPASAEAEIWKNYQAQVEMFYDHLKMNKELRDLDFRKNLEAKQALIDRAKALAEEKDVVAAGRNLQELHDKWREIGPVAKEYRESIWEEFRAASSIIRRAHQEYFEARKAAEAEAEAQKTALCEEIEALDYSQLKKFNEWDEFTKKILDLQARWKKLGFASRKVNTLLFNRFRKSCDDFFNAKAEFYRQTKEELAQNLEKKTALCERAEALRDSEDKAKAAEEIRKLQAEWRTIGGVARRHSDAIWQRFTTACNAFFEERKQRISGIRKEEAENLAAKKEVIAQLAAIDPEQIENKEGIAQVRELQQRWQEIGHVPFKLKDKLYEEYRTLCDKLYDAFDFRGNRRRAASFRNRVEEMGSDDSRLGRERERLYREYEKKRSELKTYENNMGFFKFNSSEGNSMAREMEKRIERIKQDLNELKNKIELIDDKMD